jgi:hypothetical protein
LTSQSCQPHDCVAMDPGEAFGLTHPVAFVQVVTVHALGGEVGRTEDVRESSRFFGLVY